MWLCSLAKVILNKKRMDTHKPLKVVIAEDMGWFFFYFFFFFFFFVFLGPPLQYMEVLRLGVKLEL